MDSYCRPLDHRDREPARVQEAQRLFYSPVGFGWARHNFQPRDFGIDMEKDEFIDLMVDEINAMYRGQWSAEELVLHPREALQFCDHVRRKHGFYDLPDDIILRVIMQRRKNA